MKEPKVTQVIAKSTSRFLSLFENVYDNGKRYMVASRNAEYNGTPSPVAAVTIFAMNADKSRMLITNEFRYAVSGMTTSTPAGLIDDGESPVEAAMRELREETGYKTLISAETLPATYSSVGMTDERVQPVILVIDENDVEDVDPIEGEIISARWVTRKEAMEIATTGTDVTARCQLALMLFATGQL